MELVTIQNIVFTILLVVMPLLSLCLALTIVFNLNKVDSRTSLKCIFLGILMVVPALTILLTLTK